MHPVLFSTNLFGLLDEPLTLHTYGLLIASGFLLAMTLSKRQAVQEHEDPDRVVDVAFYLLLSGLVGARIVFIITKLDEYLRNPVEMLMFWRGGLVWYGGFIGAALYLAYYCRKHRLSYFKYVDLFIPYMAMAHAFGRLGCVAAGCCFGNPTDLPWGIVYPAGSMAQQAHHNEGLVGLGDPSLGVHPTQLYEAGAELLMFWLLVNMRPFKRFHGQLFLVWLAVYPVFRSGVEMLRGDEERGIAFGWSTSQIISVGVAAAAVVIYFWLRKERDARAARGGVLPRDTSPKAARAG